MKASTSSSVLWVCWEKPATLPEANAVILSFLSPSADEDVEKNYDGMVVHAREASLCVRNAAREIYLEMVARIGIAKGAGGRTFRQQLARNDETSWWWYHAVSFRDCESDFAFEWIVAVLTIENVARMHQLNRIVLVGAPSPIAEVLRAGFEISELQTNRPRSPARTWLRGVAARAKYLLTSLRQLAVVKKGTKIAAGPFTVALSSFWDWSVFWDSETASPRDRYYKKLPDELERLGARVGWFAWFDPHAEPGKEDRSLADVLATTNGSERVVILQSFLKAWDVLRAISDLRPLFVYLGNRRRAEFRQSFQEQALNYYPLFRAQMVTGFLDSSLPHHRLVKLATQRAVQKYKPQVAFCFLEHFPHSRAQYDGIRRANTETTSFAVQHASYSRDKTFLALHPSIEFKGEPDGCAVPHPDQVCAMGTWGQKLFLECGYENDAVVLTGSPRYDHVRMAPAEIFHSEGRETETNEQIQVLMVGGLDVNVELEMVEALCAALNEISGIRLLLRNHPFRRVDNDPRFAQFGSRVEITNGSLDEDLSQADLILFTYSTVAEEAVLKGKPVWQWLVSGLNRSALADVIEIPRFGSVVKLRDALLEFQANRSRFTPDKDLREQALEALFYRGDGGAARRVSEVYLREAGQLAGQGSVNG